MRLLFTVLACLFSVSVFGQGWEQTYGYSVTGQNASAGSMVVETSDGGFVIVMDGFDYNSLIKTNNIGIAQWIVSIPEPDGLIQTNDNGVIIASGGEAWDSELTLLKFDENGVNQWSQSYSIEGGAPCVSKTSDGGYILACRATDCIGEPIGCVGLVKVSSDGIEQWSNIFYVDNFAATPVSIQQTADGGYIIGGTHEGAGISDSGIFDVLFREPVLIKTDINGNFQWQHNYGFLHTDQNNLNIDEDFFTRMSSVRQTNDGGFIFQVIVDEGAVVTPNGVIPWDDAVVLVKTNFLGIEEWSKTFTPETLLPNTVVDLAYEMSDGYDFCYLGIPPSKNNNLISNAGDNYFFTVNSSVGIGESPNSGMVQYTVLVIVDNNGDIIEIVEFSNITEIFESYLLNEGLIDWSGKDLISVDYTSDGGYILTGGYNASVGANPNLLLIKTDSEGTLSSEFTIPTPSPKKLDKVVDALGREVNNTTNQILFHIYDDGTVEKKFIVE
tara:strand:- start:256 stop:1749 length:1494 start_codon:yes stop_codon:yes gene_type:complete